MVSLEMGLQFPAGHIPNGSFGAVCLPICQKGALGAVCPHTGHDDAVLLSALERIHGVHFSWAVEGIELSSSLILSWILKQHTDANSLNTILNAHVSNHPG